LADCHRRHVRTAAAVLVVLSLASCRASDTDPRTSDGDHAPDGSLLPAVVLPDLSKLAPSVQTQIRERHAALTAKRADRHVRPGDLAAAYGELGRLLMAAQSDAAEPYFVNAQVLEPSDHRWPYYLAHLARRKGNLAEAGRQFERVLALQPTDVAALFWLGDVHLAQGRADAAEPHFARALELQPSSLSARFGLGRTALARRDYRRAVEHLEIVLARDPGAAGVHYPLALAYRALGDERKAEAHLQQRREHDILPADPLMVELDGLLESAQTYESLGIKALDRHDWSAAVDLFRRGLALEPNHAALRHRLGTALYMMGDQNGARAEFERALAAEPEFARAHYSLGVLAASAGQHADAIRYFAAAVGRDPDYAEARLRLAASLRATRRPGESVTHYDRVLALDPANVDARMGQALALVQLARYTDARDRLAEATKAYPAERVFAHALARLLATAPDDRVRDGRRALALVQELLRQQQPTPDLGETMAMALAELGRFQEAISIQRDLIAGGERAGARDVVRRLTENLRRYERGEPCRTPWTEQELS
jgi:tetratricopeptide (TPR) repeat protein